MGKQRCGTCRFFEDAGLAGSGWCHHPLRKTTNDLLIMVRRNELACRDEWSHSLWEPGTFNGESAVETEHDESTVTAGRPAPPATEAEIAALLKPTAAANDDVVLAEARIATESRPAWSALAAPEPASPRRTYDAKTALKRAREAYRERARQHAAEEGAAIAPLAADAAAGPERPVEAEPPGASSSVASGHAGGEPEIAVANLDLIIGDGGKAVDADTDHAAETPMVEAEPDAPAALEDTDLVIAGPDDEVVPAAEVWADPVFAPLTADSWEPSPEAVVIAPVASGRFRPIAAPDSTLVESPAASWAPALDPDLDKWWSSERTDDPARAWDRWDDEAWSSDEFVEPHEAARQRIDSDPIAASDDAGAVTSTAVAEPLSFDITSWDDEALAAATAISPLDGGWGSGRAAPPVDLAPGVPRICRTCRDFRPAEGGERGWCANQWAFTHRRMVGADDPAPCESSIGCWWLPADDLFLSDADISTHGQPTPHLDRWLPHWDDADVKRRKS